MNFGKNKSFTGAFRVLKMKINNFLKFNTVPKIHQ